MVICGSTSNSNTSLFFKQKFLKPAAASVVFMSEMDHGQHQPETETTTSTGLKSWVLGTASSFSLGFMRR